MINHPALTEALTRDRALELRRCAEASRPIHPENRRPRVTEIARRGTGWLLVDIGLRLAVPRTRADA